MMMVKNQIVKEDYLACDKIWNEFNMKNMSDYHNHYLKKDVLLLAYVHDKLDLFHYFSSPGLSWNAMLKMTGIDQKKLQTLTCTYSLKKD